MSYYDLEIYADDYCELQQLLREESVEQINWLFAEAQEDELPL